MKTTIKKLLFIIMMVSLGLSISAETLTVTSALDSGPGTLRQLIIDAFAGDSIVIPEDYTIVLASTIEFNKSLAINGQGSVVKVPEPGLTPYRVFMLGTTAEVNKTVSMYNLHIEGGDALTSFAGAIYVRTNHNFTMKNCTISKAKGAYAGAIFAHKATGTSITLEDCTFSDCESTQDGGGALYLRGKVSINDCTFSNNVSKLNGSAIYTLLTASGSLISNCRFIGNVSHGGIGGTVSNYSTSNSMDLENCTFESNTNTGELTGTSGFAIAHASAKSTLTNCTFYNNTGASSGAIYNGGGALNLMNSTFVGNSTPSTNGGAYHDINIPDCKTTMVNNIFAYNYNSSGLMDVSVNALSVLSGQNNIIGAISGLGTPTFTSPVTFTYDPSTDLFASYTTTGNLMPMLADNGGLTKTVALSATSIAYGAGTTTFGVPSLIPITDQRGTIRATTPSIGSYEVANLTAVAATQQAGLYIYIDASKVLNLSKVSDVIRLDIIDLSGKKVFSVTQPTVSISLNSLAKGIYLVHITTLSGNRIQKFCIQ